MSLVGQMRTDGNSVLDEAQLNRIESVHRGFLYQHLYGVGCLLNLVSKEDGLITVERNEDVEIVTDTEKCLIQIKTRSRPIRLSDISTALDHFDRLRATHDGNSAVRRPRFAIVSNIEPGPDLEERLGSPDWPHDVAFSSPGHLDHVHELAPPPWRSVESALEWCVSAATQLPFQSISPDTLVWKLAARVQFAATGDDDERRNHAFRRVDLPDLFDLLVRQLQEFPAIPTNYRPQLGEPDFGRDQRVQLITAFAGGGKTIWSSWQAKHTTADTIYFDVGDLSGSALASSIARELAARFVSGRGTGAAQIPARTGLDALRVISQEIRLTQSPIVIVDNVHRVDPMDMRQVIEACSTVRFVLIGRPWENQVILEGMLGITAERLPGWDRDTVASVFHAEGVKVDPASASRWREITGGLPLYVTNAAQLCNELYPRGADQFLSAVRSDAHPVALSQEAILKLLFEHLNTSERTAVAALSLTNVKLSNDELCAFFSALPALAHGSGSTLRSLNRRGIVQVFSDGGRKLHDVLRLPARSLQDELPQADVQRLRSRLRDILFSSLEAERDITRFGAWIRLLAPTGQVDTLVDLATSEIFHELGDPQDLKAVLTKAAREAGEDRETAFWALDAVTFWELQEGSRDSDPEPYLRQLEDLIRDGGFSRRQESAVVMKRMMVFGKSGDRRAMERTFTAEARLCEGDSLMSRVLRYNYANALFRGGHFRDACRVAFNLSKEYYDLLEIDVTKVVGADRTQMSALIHDVSDKIDDIKHLGDCLDVVARCMRHLGQNPGLAAIHAVKFYELSGAHRSQMRAAQDVVDDFISIGDFEYALELMEGYVLPLLKHMRFDSHLVEVRGQYAVILAYNGRHDEAGEEMERVVPYVEDLPHDHRASVRNQQKMVKEMAEGRMRTFGAKA